jgi:hypothetical protein
VIDALPWFHEARDSTFSNIEAGKNDTEAPPDGIGAAGGVVTVVEVGPVTTFRCRAVFALADKALAAREGCRARCDDAVLTDAANESICAPVAPGQEVLRWESRGRGSATG